MTVLRSIDDFPANGCTHIAAIPVLASSQRHPIGNTLVYVYLKGYNASESVYDGIYPISTNDCKNLSVSELLDFLSSQRCYVYMLKEFEHAIGVRISTRLGVYDLCSLLWFYESKTDFDVPPFRGDALQRYRSYERFVPNVNAIIPTAITADSIYQFLEENHDGICSSFLAFDTVMVGAFGAYSHDITNAYGTLESNGVCVDGKIQYTQYHPYTVTGRPSNHWGGFNYAAINKSNGDRNKFISRFEDGKMVQFDYDGFHVALIAKLIDFELPRGINPHYYLGQLYHGKTELTKQEYNESKVMSFKYLYGGIPDELCVHEFFQKTRDAIFDIWHQAQSQGHVNTLVYGKPIRLATLPETSRTPMTVFNYLLQSFETEYNLGMLVDIHKHLQDTRSKLVLYTYDSFLIDTHPDELEHVLAIRDFLQRDGFACKASIGNSYGEMYSLEELQGV